MYTEFHNSEPSAGPPRAQARPGYTVYRGQGTVSFFARIAALPRYPALPRAHTHQHPVTPTLAHTASKHISIPSLDEILFNSFNLQFFFLLACVSRKFCKFYKYEYKINESLNTNGHFDGLNFTVDSILEEYNEMRLKNYWAKIQTV